jgi:adenine-specific DNA-methyltransferase
MPAKKKTVSYKSVEAIKHDDAKRKNIPSAEQQSFIQKEQEKAKELRYPRNTDLDPQLVWRGKDEQDWSDLVVHAPPLYIQEKVHPKALIDDLLRQSKETAPEAQFDLFADFNGIPKGADKTEFYAHDQNWSNRMILGDSLQVMASLAEREGLRGRVQCIYFDPPYGIKFNSNFQWSTTSRDVKDGKADHITREPEQVKAFRDTWRDGIHSYLTYLRDRLTVARDLLTDSGSIFVQIGDENVHRVRAVMDEVFGEDNFCCFIPFRKRQGRTSSSDLPEQTHDFIVWYAKNKKGMKYRQLYLDKSMSKLELFYDNHTGQRVALSQDEKDGLKALPVSVDEIYTRIPLELQSPNSARKFTVAWRGESWVAPP